MGDPQVTLLAHGGGLRATLLRAGRAAGGAAAHGEPPGDWETPGDAAARGAPQVTLLREHCQGPNAMMFVLPTGGFDPRRHGDREACARAELSEEARLAGGAWQRLLPPGHAGLAEVKWSPNRFTPFLCIGPEARPRAPSSLER